MTKFLKPGREENPDYPLVLNYTNKLQMVKTAV